MDSIAATGPSPITADEIERLLAEHEQSDLSLAAFARLHDVPPYRLYDARRRAREQRRERSGGAAFTEVQVVESSRGPTTPVELVLPSGLIVRVARDFDEVALRRLLGILSTC